MLYTAHGHGHGTQNEALHHLTKPSPSPNLYHNTNPARHHIQAKATAASEAVVKIAASVERTERQLSGEGSAIGNVLERVEELREMLRPDRRSPVGLRPAGSAPAVASTRSDN